MQQSFVHPVTPMQEYKRGLLPLISSCSYVVTSGHGGTNPGGGGAYSSSHVVRPLAGCASWGGTHILRVFVVLFSKRKREFFIRVHGSGQQT